MKNDDVIFVHIPKTGGTTINTAMEGTVWANEADFNYRHLITKTKKSNAGDIFQIENIEKYKAYKIFMMLRHPIDRIISEYYFIHHRPQFMESIKHKPKNFNDYVRSRQTQNGTVTFLKGREFYSRTAATESDLEEIKECITSIPVHVGIFEHFAESMSYFSEATGLKWKKNLEVKRVTLKRPKSDDLSQEMKEYILKTNHLDLELYNFCLQRFNEIRAGIKKPKFEFVGDKYDHIIPFCHNQCLFVFCLNNKKYLKQNMPFFKGLNFHLLNMFQIKDGKLFTKLWNDTFIKAVNHHFPDSEFSDALNGVYHRDQEPLEVLVNIASAIDDYFQQGGSSKNKYYTPMTFDASLISNPNEFKEKKSATGFFKKLFKK